MRIKKRIQRVFISRALCLAFPCIIGCGSATQTSNPAIVSGSGSGSVTTPTPTFRLAAAPPSVTVEVGSAASYTVTLTAVNGFDAGVTPAVTGLPDGASGTFTLQTVTPTATGAVTTMAISTASVTAGMYTLTVTGVGGGLQKQQTVQLVVTAPPALGGLNGTIE